MVKIIEGTVDEIVEYQARVGQLGSPGDPAAVEAEPADRPEAAARATSPEWDAEDSFFVHQFVYNRAASGAAAGRLMRYLKEVAAMGTVVEAGLSERSRDGFTDYLMVRDEGPRRFGAIAYVRPKNAGLTLRLQPQHVEDVDDSRVQLREVVATQRYAVNCPLVDDQAVELAVELTRRALGLVRK